MRACSPPGGNAANTGKVIFGSAGSSVTVAVASTVSFTTLKPTQTPAWRDMA